MFNTSVPAVSVSSELCSSDDDRWRVFSLLFVTPVDDRRLPFQQQQHDEEERLDDDAGPSIPLDDFLVLERDFIFMNTTPMTVKDPSKNAAAPAMSKCVSEKT